MDKRINIEAERAAFEAAMAGKLDFLCQPGADYFYAETGLAWDVWLAARSAPPATGETEDLPPLPPARNKARDFEGWAEVYTNHEVENIRREAIAHYLSKQASQELKSNSVDAQKSADLANKAGAQPDQRESAAEAKAILERAADMLEGYAKYCYRVKPAEIEEHPYIPSIEEAAEELRALAGAASPAAQPVAKDANNG
jgi:hypothetical protein